MSDLQQACVDQLPDSIKQGEGPVFAEPWQAQAFAMTVSLLEQGKFTWNEWAECIGAEIANARANGIADDGSEYYLLWLRALEHLVTDKQLADRSELEVVKDKWHHAYESTPHGQKVVID